jgi:tetratricopeptide (TPR) repeat protein
MGFLKWLASLFGGQSNIQIGKNNPSAQTGDNSLVQQTTIDRVEGSVSIGADAERIVLGTIDRVFQASAAQLSAERDQSLIFSEEVGRLKEQLASAVRRAEEAEQRGVPDAKGLIEQLRESDDTARLLEFLLAQEDTGKEDLVELRREIAAVAYLRGKIDIAERALKDILRVLPDDLDALNRMGHIHRMCGRLDEAMANYRRVLDLATKQKDQTGQAAAYGNLGLIYRTRGDLAEAERMHRKSLEISEQLGRQEGMAAAYDNLGLIYRTRGDLDEAERVHRKSLEIDEQLGRQEGMAATYGNLGLIYRTRGDLDEAERMHRKSLEIDEQLGRQEGMAATYGNLGIIYGTRGDLDEAEWMLRKSLKINEQLGRQKGMAIQYGNLGVIYRTRGDLDEAERMHRKSLEINKQLGHQEGMASDYGNLGAIYEMRGDDKQAREHWIKSRDLFARIGAPHMVKQVQGWIDELDAAEESGAADE